MSLTQTPARLMEVAASACDPNEVVRTCAAAAAFRAATVDELVNESNPFRRPVRPGDLSFLDYSTELLAEEVGEPELALGHRMLLNAYETDLLFLPDTQGSASSTDSRSFYSIETRLLANLALPAEVEEEEDDVVIVSRT